MTKLANLYEQRKERQQALWASRKQYPLGHRVPIREELKQGTLREELKEISKQIHFMEGGDGGGPGRLQQVGRRLADAERKAAESGIGKVRMSSPSANGTPELPLS